VAFEQVIIGVFSEEAEQRCPTVALVAHTHTAEIGPAGGDIDGFIESTFFGENRLVVTHGPAPEKM